MTLFVGFCMAAALITIIKREMAKSTTNKKR